MTSMNWMLLTVGVIATVGGIFALYFWLVRRERRGRKELCDLIRARTKFFKEHPSERGNPKYYYWGE